MRLTYLSGRRAFLGGSIGAGVLLSGRARALTGNAELDTAAIPVRSPSRVFLVAIARAGDRLVAVGEHGVVIYSDDSGVTWVQARVPVNVTLTCVAFATPLLGWAAGHAGVVLNTTDGGKMWQMQLNGIQVNQLTLTAAQAAQTANTPSPALPLALKRAGLFVESGPSKPFLAVLALSPEKIIVFGAYRMTVLTMDGGKTWVDWSLNIYDRLSHNLQDAILVGSKIYVAAEAGLVFCSTDGGATFPQVTSPCAATLFGIVGAGDGSIIAFGVAGNAARSTDGGQSWTPVDCATQDNLVAGRLLRSGAIVIAQEAGGLLISHNNGVAFTQISDLPPMFASDFVQAPDADLVFAGGGGVTKVLGNLLNT